MVVVVARCRLAYGVEAAAVTGVDAVAEGLGIRVGHWTRRSGRLGSQSCRCREIDIFSFCYACVYMSFRSIYIVLVRDFGR